MDGDTALHHFLPMKFGRQEIYGRTKIFVKKRKNQWIYLGFFFADSTFKVYNLDEWNTEQSCQWTFAEIKQWSDFISSDSFH